MTISGKEFLGGKPAQVVQSAGGLPFNVPNKEERKSIWQNIQDDIAKRQGNFSESVEKQSQGKQSALTTGLNLAGNAVGLAFDAAGEAIKPALESPLGKVATKAIAAVPEEGIKQIKSISDQTGLSEKIKSEWENFKTQHPEAASNLESGGELSKLLLLWTGGPATDILSGTKALGESVASGVKNTVTGATDIIKSVPKTIGSEIEKVVKKPVPKPVESVLKETQAKTFDEYADIARKATESNKNATPLEVAGQKAQSALDTIQRKLSNIGGQKSSIISQAAVGNKPVGSIVTKFRQELSNAIKGKTSIEGNKRVFQDVLTEAEKLGANPSAKQVDGFIDFVQDRIYSGKRDLSIPITDDVEQILRPITGKLNESLKTQLPESYRNLNKQFADMVDTRNELNSKLGYEGEKGGSLMKRVFSPSDARTKKLFEEVKKLTGVDLVNEATLAKFVMETLGDARQMSMLEQLKLPTTLSKKGALEYLVDKATSGFNTPEEMLRRARELTIPETSLSIPLGKGNPTVGQTVKKIGVGEFGNIYEGIKGQNAVTHLLETKNGEIKNAFYNHKLGDIDLIWGNGGSRGYGLSHLIEQHPELIEKLDEIISNGKILRQDIKSAYLQTKNGTVAIRLDWLGKPKRWVLTAY